MEKGSKNKKEAREEKLREEQVTKSMEECLSQEEKSEFLLRKYLENEKKISNFQRDLKAQEKQLDAVMREKESLQRELNRNVLMKDKLQEVCREQQKIIKSVKNESLLKIKEEEERRKESQAKFQCSLNEITQSLSKNNEENIKLRDYNIEMTKKLKFLAEQYQTREKQLEKLNEQVELESQLHQAKLNKLQVEAAMEKEILSKENQISLEKLVQAQKMVRELTERELALKDQLNLYTAKYDDFQSSLQKSNDIFATYKVELEKMSKNTKKLEKESIAWKNKYEKSNATVIMLATEKKERDEHAERCSKQVDQLQKLLRALQNERTHLYKVLRDNNIEIPPLPALPPEPEPIKVTPISSVNEKDKMEMMSRNCAELKQTLANLQNQMKMLNVGGATEAPADNANDKQQQQHDKKRQKRKSKSKVNKNNNKEQSPHATASADVEDEELVPQISEHIVEHATEETESIGLLNVSSVATETEQPAATAELAAEEHLISMCENQILPGVEHCNAVTCSTNSQTENFDTPIAVVCDESALN